MRACAAISLVRCAWEWAECWRAAARSGRGCRGCGVYGHRAGDAGCGSARASPTGWWIAVALRADPATPFADGRPEPVLETLTAATLFVSDRFVGKQEIAQFVIERGSLRRSTLGPSPRSPPSSRLRGWF